MPRKDVGNSTSSHSSHEKSAVDAIFRALWISKKKTKQQQQDFAVIF